MVPATLRRKSIVDDSASASPPLEDDLRVRVRLAGEGDDAVIGRHVAMATTDARAYRGADRLESLGSHRAAGRAPEERLAMVAEFGSSVIGSLVGHRRGDREWSIDHVYVIEDCRSVGAGDALVEGALAWLRSRGVVWVSARALPGDREMKNLWERHGMTARVIEVGRTLE